MSAETIEKPKPKTTRGTSSKNAQGSSADVRARKRYLLETYASDQLGIKVTYADHQVPGLPTSKIGKTQIFIPEPGRFMDVWNTQRRIQAVHNYIVSIEEVPTCRCYRCGRLLHYGTLTVDRIVPGCIKTSKYPKGGTYVRENIRPACGGKGGCNTILGAAMANAKALAKKKVRR